MFGTVVFKYDLCAQPLHDRTRLPLTAEGFSQRFKLQSFSRSPADDYLPVAHTCFFSLELPAYSSLEVEVGAG